MNHGEMDDEDSMQEAANPQEFMALMKMFGNKVKITRMEGQPVVSPAIAAFKKNTTVAALPADFKLENPAGVFKAADNTPIRPPEPVQEGNEKKGGINEASTSLPPPPPQGQSPRTTQPVVAAPVVPVVEFENGGIKFKIDQNIVYKKDWIDVDMNEYRLDPATIGIEDELVKQEILGRVRIQKLDWIKIENSPKN